MAWHDQLETLVMRSVESLMKFSGLSTGMVGRVPSADALLRISEAYLHFRSLSTLVMTRRPLLAVDVLNSVVITEANDISAFERIAGEEHLDEAESALSGLDPEKFPHLSRLSHMAMQPTPGERARRAIRTFIQGLAVNKNSGRAPG